MLVVQNFPHRTRDQDLPRIKQYLKDNPDPDVRIRPEPELRNAWETGCVYGVTRDGELVGVSLLYAFEQGHFTSYEIGTVHIHECVRGLGLQEFVNAFQIYQTAAIVEADEWDAYDVFAVAKSGKASFHVLANKLAMMPQEPSLALSKARADRDLEFDTEKSVLFMDRPSVDKAAVLLRSCHRGGVVFSTPKKDWQIRFEADWFEESDLDVWE